MRGIGRASGAITIVNALLAGRGCAAAIAIDARAIAELDRTAPGELPSVRVDPASDTPVVREALRAALRSIAPTEHVDVRLRVESELPPARGLKSSSAVGAAVLEAVHRAWGILPDPLAIARAVAEIGRTSGLSATGAFDDACASVLGGVVRTDNRDDELLSLEAMDPSWAVLLWVPEEPHAPSPSLAPRFQGLETAAREVIAAAEERRYATAMNGNTELVEHALGYSYRTLRQRLRERGAIAAGVSGMGPTLAAIVRPSHAGSVAEALPRSGGTILRTTFQPPRDPERVVPGEGPP
jgi:shikimate kinase